MFLLILSDIFFLVIVMLIFIVIFCFNGLVEVLIKLNVLILGCDGVFECFFLWFFILFNESNFKKCIIL